MVDLTVWVTLKTELPKTLFITHRSQRKASWDGTVNKLVDVSSTLANQSKRECSMPSPMLIFLGFSP